MDGDCKIVVGTDYENPHSRLVFIWHQRLNQPTDLGETWQSDQCKFLLRKQRKPPCISGLKSTSSCSKKLRSKKYFNQALKLIAVLFYKI